jgi:hypothetical protein
VQYLVHPDPTSFTFFYEDMSTYLLKSESFPPSCYDVYRSFAALYVTEYAKMNLSALPSGFLVRDAPTGALRPAGGAKEEYTLAVMTLILSALIEEVEAALDAGTPAVEALARVDATLAHFPYEPVPFSWRMAAKTRCAYADRRLSYVDYAAGYALESRCNSRYKERHHGSLTVPMTEDCGPVVVGCCMLAHLLRHVRV